MTELPARVRVCLFGLGAIGCAVGRHLLNTPGVEITGAVDTDPRKAGRDLRAVLKLKGHAGLTVSAEAEAGLKQAAAHVVVHCTGSRLRDVASQIEMIVDAGAACVSSCEEMAFPDLGDPVITANLDRRAKARGVAVVGGGVNPGFVMDALVLALSGATRDVSHVSVERVLDPLKRRKAFQKKVGLSLNYRQAQRLVSQGRLGHVGMAQSAMLVARGLDWAKPEFSEEIRVLCDDDDGFSTPRRPRRPPEPDASVIGLQQTLIGRVKGKELLRMEMIMAAGVEAPHDAIIITGDPDLNCWIHGGIHGDQATVACLVNAIPQIITAPRAGLLTLLDLPLRPAWRHSASA